MTEPTGAVFVSYASQDAEAAQRICEALREAGIEAWFDQNELRGGDAWDRRIRGQIHDCRLFLAVVSAHTEARVEGYFRREWKLAVDRTHDLSERVAFLVPIVIDDTPEAKADVPDAFRRVQWTRLRGGEATPAFVSHVAGLLNRDATPSASSPASAPAAQPWRTEPKRSSHVWRAVALSAVIVVLASAYYFLTLRHRGDGQPGTAGRVTASEARAAMPEKSIAVLPFVDLSEGHDQEYFADGLSEELIDRLAQAKDFRVIARTSSFQFKGRSEDVRSIGTKLDVVNLLEGSVRKSGAALRITAQLIRVSDGTHLWSHTYAGSIRDVFKVQDEIAESVATALEAALSDRRGARSASTSTEAYEDVLKGIYFWNRSEPGDSARALALFEAATRLDPNYAHAWKNVAAVYGSLGYSGIMPNASARQRSLDAVNRALSLDPLYPAAHAVLGGVYRDIDWNWLAAKREFDHAARLDPNGDYDVDAGYLNWILKGDIKDEVEALRRALRRDPLDAGRLFTLGLSYFAARRYQESADTYAQLLELNPRYARAASWEGWSLTAMGQYEKALNVVLTDSEKSAQLSILPCIYWKLGRRSDSDTSLAELQKNATRSAYFIARMHACRGEPDKTFEWLERGREQRQHGMQNVKYDPFFWEFHSDPRFYILLAKMNLAE